MSNTEIVNETADIDEVSGYMRFMYILQMINMSASVELANVMKDIHMMKS